MAWLRSARLGFNGFLVFFSFPSDFFDFGDGTLILIQFEVRNVVKFKEKRGFFGFNDGRLRYERSEMIKKIDELKFRNLSTGRCWSH